jgi:1,4-dihydroxy-2-naphthoate octaprenyltransferase
MRDIENDKASQKNTIPVVLGLINAKRYHLLVLTIALSSILVYSLLTYQSLMQLLYFLVLPLFVKHLIEVKKCLSNKDFNPMLPKLAIATFLLSLLFFIGEMLSKH